MSHGRIHLAWIVLGAVMLVMLAASGLRSVFGWDRASLSGAAALSLFLLGAVGPFAGRLADREAGLKLYGAGQAAPSPGMISLPSEARISVTEAAQVPAFWLLAITFFVCGYTSSGLVLTHLIPHSMEHGFSEMTAAQALGVMGAMNILGTVASGWICDRFGRKGPLAFYYFVRGLSLLFLLYVWNIPSLNLFAALFGLNYISTVPPTTTLTANIFGRYSVGELSGWIFFSHQVGAALGAAIGGWIFDWTGSYSWAFVSAAVLAIIAAGLSLMIREEPVSLRPTPAASAAVPSKA